jgi:2'-5' RNA ligase
VVDASRGQIKSSLPEASWIVPENLHMTLNFIGDVNECVAEDIDVALRGIEAASFDLTITGVGYFESRNKVRAVWAGVAAEPDLRHLHAKVAQALILAGQEPEHRKFRPHVTLARLKRVPVTAVAGYLEAQAELLLPPYSVDYFTLFRSHLGHAGAAYEALARYQLNAS